MKKLLLGLLTIASTVTAQPRTMIDFNQFDFKYMNQLHHLRADVCMASFSNSKDATSANIKEAIKRVGCTLVLTSDGGINPMQLLDEPNWTGQPRNLNLNARMVRNAGVPVHFYMLYTEYNRQHQGQTLLTPDDLRLAFRDSIINKIIPLIRAFNDSERSIFAEIMKMSRMRYPGMYVEIAASVKDVQATRTCDIMKAIQANNRLAFVMLSGRTPSQTYAADVTATCTYIKRTCPNAFNNAIFGVAVYELENKGINWISGPNSVTGAMRSLRACIGKK